MSMDHQPHRPLSGSTTGAPILLGTGTAIHTTDATSAALGGNFMQWLSLWVSNTHTAAQTITVTVGAISINVIVPAGTIVQVFDDHPIRGATPGTGVAITGTNVSALGAAHVFGYFFAG